MAVQVYALRKWLDEKEREQEQLEAHEPPAFTSVEVLHKMMGVQKIMARIQNKKPPTPKPPPPNATLESNQTSAVRSKNPFSTQFLYLLQEAEINLEINESIQPPEPLQNTEVEIQSDADSESVNQSEVDSEEPVQDSESLQETEKPQSDHTEL